MDLTQADYLRAALANAILEDMSLDDVMECAIHAATIEDFEEAVNVLAQTVPGDPCNIVTLVIK